jgi:hypothetical protein
MKTKERLGLERPINPMDWRDCRDYWHDRCHKCGGGSFVGPKRLRWCQICQDKQDLADAPRKAAYELRMEKNKRLHELRGDSPEPLMGSWGQPFVPDYCSNLNAVHEVEMGLDKFNYGKFCQHFQDVANCYGGEMGWCREFVSATAEARVDALILTLQESAAEIDL